MPKVNTHFTRRVDKLLKSRKWSVFDLSRAACIREQTIRGWYTTCSPRAAHLACVADALGVSMDYLWGRTTGTDEEQNP